jgi:hypothetical protein
VSVPAESSNGAWKRSGTEPWPYAPEPRPKASGKPGLFIPSWAVPVVLTVTLTGLAFLWQGSKILAGIEARIAVTDAKTEKAFGELEGLKSRMDALILALQLPENAPPRLPRKARR